MTLAVGPVATTAVIPGTEVAQQLLAASRSRRFLDCRAGDGLGEIAADDVRRACLASEAERDPFGVRIANARIVGTLDLRAATVASPLHFVSCTFSSALQVEGANLHELSITDGRHGGEVPPNLLATSELPGLLANGVRIRRDLVLSGTLITGAHTTSASLTRSSAIWLTEAQIGGRLLAVGTQIRATGDRALQCDRTQVAGDIRLIHGFSATAEVRLIAVQLAGSLDLTASSLIPANGRALDLSESVIGGSLFILDDPDHEMRPQIRGRLEMGNVTIHGRVLVRNADLHAPPAGSGLHDYNTEEPANRTLLLAPRLAVHGEVTIEAKTSIYGGLRLHGADIKGGFRMVGGTLSNGGDVAVDLSQAALGSGLDMRAAHILGTVNLANARIAGPVDIQQAVLRSPYERRCLIGVAAQITGDIRMVGLEATGGSVNFRGASVGGDVDAEAAVLTNTGDKTLSLHQARIAGNVRLCKGFASTGLVVLNRVTIDGRLRCDGAELAWRTEESDRSEDLETNPRGAAFEAISAVVRAGIRLGWRITAGAVDFSDARTTHLADDPTADWPTDSYLTGFVYERFAPLDMQVGHGVWDAETRSQWLARVQPDDPQPWEQAAMVLRTNGDRVGAEQILIAQRRCARRRRVGVNRRRYRRVFDAIQDFTVGYGHRPHRALAILLALIASVAFSLSLPTARASMRAADPGTVVSPDSPTVTSVTGSCGGGRVRCLNPVLYAIDTVVPIIDLGQRNTWYPSGGATGTLLAWWLNLCTVLGWIASTVFALSFTRLGRTAKD